MYSDIHGNYYELWSNESSVCILSIANVTVIFVDNLVMIWSPVLYCIVKWRPYEVMITVCTEL